MIMDTKMVCLERWWVFLYVYLKDKGMRTKFCFKKVGVDNAVKRTSHLQEQGLPGTSCGKFQLLHHQSISEKVIIGR